MWEERQRYSERKPKSPSAPETFPVSIQTLVNEENLNALLDFLKIKSKQSDNTNKTLETKLL